jgi:hypothetical protein
MTRRLSPRWHTQSFWPGITLVSRVRTGLAAAMAAGLVAAVVAAATSHGYSAAHPQQGTGSIWLPSDATGELTLFDSSTLGPAGQVRLARPGSALLVAQAGDTGYAVDEDTGDAWRVDGATLTASLPATHLIPAGPDAAIFATAGAFYAISGQHGLRAVAASPSSLTAIGTEQSAAASITSADTTVDQDGRLWILDQHSGDLSWFTGGTRHVRPRAIAPGTAAALTAADGQPVIVLPGQRIAQLLNPGTGTVQQTIRVPWLLPGDAITAAGSADTRQVVLAVGARGLAVVCSFSAATCRQPTRLPYRGPAALGQPVQLAGRVFIPDDTSGSVIIINLGSGTARVSRQIFGQPTQFDLLAKDGIVFYNDPWSSAAGVISPAGLVSMGSKYTTAPASPRPPGRVPPATAQVVRPAGTPTPAPATPAPATPAPARSGPSGPLVITGIAVTPAQPATGQSATFTASYTGSAPASWSWGIGPGTASYPTLEPTLRTTFSAPGTYTVTVTSGTARMSITVSVVKPNAQCGEIITASLVLNANLTCPGNGLTIGASGVTLSLGGHTITGPGAAIGTTGVSVANGDAPATVKDGAVNGFSDGVAASGSTSVDSVDLAADGTDVLNNWTTDPVQGKVNLSAVKAVGGAITCFNCVVTTSDFSGTTIGTVMDGSFDASDSKFIASVFQAAEYNDTTLSGNQINDGSSVNIGNTSSASISGNTFAGDIVGITIGDPYKLTFSITGNTFRDDSAAGVLIEGNNDINFSSKVSGNTFIGDGSSPPAEHDNAGHPVADGLHIDIADDTASGLGTPPTITVARNVTMGNAAYGIWASPGMIIDGGGNTSTGNPDSCYGVRCA